MTCKYVLQIAHANYRCLAMYAGTRALADHKSAKGMLFTNTAELHPQDQQYTPLREGVKWAGAADQDHLNGTPFQKLILGVNSAVYNHDGPGMRRVLPGGGRG